MLKTLNLALEQISWYQQKASEILSMSLDTSREDGHLRLRIEFLTEANEKDGFTFLIMKYAGYHTFFYEKILHVSISREHLRKLGFRKEDYNLYRINNNESSSPEVYVAKNRLDSFYNGLFEELFNNKTVHQDSEQYRFQGYFSSYEGKILDYTPYHFDKLLPYIEKIKIHYNNGLHYTIWLNKNLR